MSILYVTFLGQRQANRGCDFRLYLINLTKYMITSDKFQCDRYVMLSIWVDNPGYVHKHWFSGSVKPIWTLSIRRFRNLECVNFGSWCIIAIKSETIYAKSVGYQSLTVHILPLSVCLIHYLNRIILICQPLSIIVWVFSNKDLQLCIYRESSCYQSHFAVYNCTTFYVWGAENLTMAQKQCNNVYK